MGVYNTYDAVLDSEGCWLMRIFIVKFLGFFFQAEDGIRDYKVTGVQTCALPISERLVYAPVHADNLAQNVDRAKLVAVDVDGLHRLEIGRASRRERV